MLAAENTNKKIIKNPTSTFKFFDKLNLIFGILILLFKIKYKETGASTNGMVAKGTENFKIEKECIKE